VPRARKERDWGAEFRSFSERGKEKAKLRARAQTASFGGSTNPSWSDVQSKLNSLGASPPLKVDGSPGQLTTAAVVAFQRSHGLTPDGVPGPATLGAMGFAGATAVGGMVSHGTFVPIKATGPSPIPGLRASVVANLPPLFGQWEGRGLPYMYTDSKGFVTTGTGNLVDSSQSHASNPAAPALALPWKRPDGSLASPSEIQAAWQVVKNAYPGVQSTASQSLTNLRLTQADIDALVLKQVGANQNVLSQVYPNIASWPSDAQMAAHSHSWAWGPGFATVWDKLGLGNLGTQYKQAVSKSPPDFVTAASAARLAGDHEAKVNPGIVPRNAAQDQMYANAADVVAKKGDYDSFFFPFEVTAAKVAIGIGGILLLGGAGFGLWYLLGSGSPRQAARLSAPSATSSQVAT
jgi:hypothetical protein